MPRYNTGNALGSTDFRDGVDNLDALDDVVNSAEETTLDRFGNQIHTLAGLAVMATGVPAIEAALSAQSARDAALLSRGVYASTSVALSKGVKSISISAAGSGGTNGVFDIAFSGGGGSGAAGKFVVAGGSIVSELITSAGSGYTSAPTLSFSASSGLTGVNASAVISQNVAVGDYFSVPSEAESIILYRVDPGPVATEVLRNPALSALPYLSPGAPNIVKNGNLSNGGSDMALYGDANPSSTDNSQIRPTANPVFNAHGCFNAISVDAGSALRGNFVEVPFYDAGFSGPTDIYASMLLYSSNGVFDYAGQAGPYIYVVHQDISTGSLTNAQAGTLATYTDLGSNVRLCEIKFGLTEPASGKFFSGFRIGVRIGASAVADFEATGFWISASSRSKRANGTIERSDTAWPDWSSVSGSVLREAGYQIANLQDRVFDLEYPKPKTLKSLADALIDPLHSVQIRCIGDSITWGTGASNPSPSTPRSHLLTDPRNNLQSPSWVNLLRDYLGKSALDESALIEESPLTTGSGRYEKVVNADPTNIMDSNFRFIHPVTGKTINKSAITYQTRTGPFFGRCIDFTYLVNNNAIIEFDIIGDNFKVIYTSQTSGSNRYCDVYVDGVLIGDFEYGAASATWNKISGEFTFPFGKHTIRLKNRSTDGGLFRLEGIRSTKKIRVINDGIIGSTSSEWIPGGSLITSVTDSDEFVFVQLGTNDRSITTLPTDPVRTKDNLRKIANHLSGLNKKVLLLACCAVTSEDSAVQKYNQGDVARVVHDLGKELGIDVVDQYRATVQLKIDGEDYLSDGLHPNDYGYRVMFDNLKAAIERAR